MKRNWKLMGAAILLALALLAGCENAASLGKKGDEQAAAGNYVQAVEFYGKAIEKKPSAQLYLSRSAAFAGQDNIAAALEDLSAALNLDSGFVDAYNARGAIYYAQGNYPSARSDYDKVLSIEPDNQNAKQKTAEIDEIEDQAATEAMKNTVWWGIPVINGNKMQTSDEFVRIALYFGEGTYKQVTERGGYYYGPSIMGFLQNGQEMVMSSDTQVFPYKIKRNRLFMNENDDEGVALTGGNIIRLEYEGFLLELQKGAPPKAASVTVTKQ